MEESAGYTDGFDTGTPRPFHSVHDQPALPIDLDLPASVINKDGDSNEQYLSTRNQRIGQVNECAFFDDKCGTAGHRRRLYNGAKTTRDLSEDCQHVKDQDTAAIVVVHHYDQHQELIDTSHRVNSPYICKAIRELVKNYPGVALNSQNAIRLGDKLQIIWHYRSELEQYVTKHRSAKDHIELCLAYMRNHLQAEIIEYDLCTTMQSMSSNPYTTASILWMFYRPGELIYSRKQGRTRVYRLVGITVSFDGTTLELESYEHGFERLVSVHMTEKIGNFAGFKTIRSLGFFPLSYHPHKEIITSELTERGRKFVSLIGLRYRSYRPGSRDFTRTQLRTSIKRADRIILDVQQSPAALEIDIYKETEGDTDELTKVETFGERAATIADNNLRSDSNNEDGVQKLMARCQPEDLMICSGFVWGYNISKKDWVRYDVCDIEEIQFESSAFDFLVLPEHKKRLISSLVSSHATSTAHSSDLLQGNGDGSIIMLHGPPGVGKTFTAESIAEHLKRPLYVLNSADLGHKAAEAEAKLLDIFQLATRWNAIVLLEDADVFSIERSALAMEHFDGTMILTTNRTDAIDPAISSRVHLLISYPALGPSERAELWTQLCSKQNRGMRPEWLTPPVVTQLSQQELNGRQIRNVVQTSHVLARSENQAMDGAFILSVIATFDASSTEPVSPQNKRPYSDGSTSSDVRQVRHRPG